MGVCESTQNKAKHDIKSTVNKEKEKLEHVAKDAKNDIKQDVKQETKQQIDDAKKNIKEAEKEKEKEVKQILKDTKHETENKIVNAKDIVLKEAAIAKDEVKASADTAMTKIEKVEKKANNADRVVKNAFKIKKGTSKTLNFINTTPQEINYSALRVKKYYQNQEPYSGEELYTDPNFPPNRNSIFGVNSDGTSIEKDGQRKVEAEASFQINEDDIVWLRPNEIFGPEYALFEGKIEFDDVRQGSIGNCYFMASISALTECPQIIAEIYRNHDIQANGCYEICLKIDGEWCVVVLDDYLPCSKATKKPIFAKPKGQELWAVLLEKAWAKVNGGYINTVAGMASEVIECLTNFPYEYNQTIHASESDEAKEELWGKILEASKTEYIMTTALPAREGAKEVGLVEGHEYTLQEGIETTYKGERIRLLKIRNPWGSINYTGKWSADYELWNDELKTIFKYKTVYDGEGEFYIDYDSFLFFFADVDICKIKERIALKQSKISYDDTIQGPRLYEIHVHKKTEIDITIFKPYYRFNRDLPTDYSYNQHLLLAKCENEETWDFSKYWGACEGQSDCSLNATVDEGSYFLYAFIDYESAKDMQGNALDINLFRGKDCMLSIYCNEFFEFHEKGADPKMSLFTRMIASYNRQNVPEEENSLLLKAENNFFKSEFSYLYIKNVKNANLDLKIDFSNVALKGIYNQEETHNVTIKENQEYIALFTCIDLYEGHGLGYNYGYKKAKKETKDSLFPQLIEFQECPSDSMNLSLYNWIYKKSNVDYSNILKKIDVSDAAFKHLKAYHPKEIEEIEGIPKLKDHESLKLEVQDKTDFGGGDWYLGEWRTVDGQFLMWGRGICVLQGTKFIGQFQNHALNGFGGMFYADGSKIEGNFVDFQPQGTCTLTHNDGKVEKVNY